MNRLLHDQDQVHRTVSYVWAFLHGGGGTQVGEVTCGGSPHLSCKRDQIEMRDYMDRRITSPPWGPPLPCKEAQTYETVL